MSSNSIYYVYQYLRDVDSDTSKEKTPFYIGKGMLNRAYNIHYNVQVPKDKSNIEILYSNLTEQEAFDKEVEMIKQYGRKDLGTGILHNRTSGGDGSSGYKHTEADILKRITGIKVKYGEQYTSTAQVPEVKAKQIATFKLNYGEQYKCSFQIPEIIKSSIKTLQATYGEQYTNSMQVPEIKAKCLKTLQSNYGEQYTSSTQVPEIKAKQLKSLQDKFGNFITGAMQADEVKAKAKITLRNNYGQQYSSSLQVPEIKAKCLKTLQSNYGKEFNNPMQVKEVRDKQTASINILYGEQYDNVMKVPEIKEKARNKINFLNSRDIVFEIKKLVKLTRTKLGKGWTRKSDKDLITIKLELLSIVTLF